MNRVGTQINTIIAQFTIYMNHSEKNLKRTFYDKPRGTVQIKSTQIRWFWGQSDGRLDLAKGGPRHSKLS